MKKMVKGFTLLEMMLVIAIIGIMATLAIPAYQDYVTRARVMEGLQMSMPARMAVNEVYLTTHELPVNQQATGYETPKPSKNISQIIYRLDFWKTNMFKFLIFGLFMSVKALSCQYEVCESRCENKFVAQGGVPLWTCAENCASCKS